MYFAKRYWLRMRKDKSIPHDGEVPASDLVEFLLRSHRSMGNLKVKDVEQAVKMYTQGKDTITMQEFQMFAMGKVYECKK